MGEAEEAEREQEHRGDDDAGVAGFDAAEGDEQLGDEERRGRQACERAEAAADHRADARVGARDAAGGMRGRGRLHAEQRHGRVEAQRLRDGMAGDVHDDPDERERVAEADAERDHAHVLEARVGQEALPGERAPEERHRDRERREPEEDEDLARGGADAPASAC